MAKVYLGLGTNLGDKEQNLCLAIEKINLQIGKVISRSDFYLTQPWGFTSENTFLNAALCVQTEKTLEQILRQTQAIEQKLGRLSKSVDHIYSDRLIDIDLLLYDEFIRDTDELKLPHPLMAERRFVIEPLAQIAPELVHPILKKTMKELLSAL